MKRLQLQAEPRFAQIQDLAHGELVAEGEAMARRHRDDHRAGLDRQSPRTGLGRRRHEETDVSPGEEMEQGAPASQWHCLLEDNAKRPRHHGDGRGKCPMFLNQPWRDAGGTRPDASRLHSFHTRPRGLQIVR